MLISFSVSNYRSFQDEQVLSMVANERYTDHLDHLSVLPGHDEKLLPVLALYGANAAGKSNLIKALAFLQEVVLQNRRIASLPTFMLKYDGRPARFELQFLSKNKIYIYGFSWKNNQIEEEWLYRQVGHARLFERTSSIDVPVELGAGKNSKKLRALATIGPKKDHLFLAQVLQELDASAWGEDFKSVFEWLRNLTIVMPDSVSFNLIKLLSNHPEFKSETGRQLSAIGTGITKVDIVERELSVEEIHSIQISSEDFQTVAQEGESIPIRIFGDGSLVYFTNTGKGRFFMQKPVLTHVYEQEAVQVSLSEESDGTQRFLQMLPAVLNRRPNEVILIDEIDRSLHSLVSKHLIRQFLQTNNARQLIFTTHDLNLMDLELFRRDEIWFAEKKKGATELYSLADFKVRKDLSIEKAYLEGRFGAVPPVEQEWPEWVQVIRQELSPHSR
jgi:AAA15 family ATPase/GTPase